MLRQTPPLEAVEAFLIAARAPSFRQAAATLALSPSALSRRVQLLEAFVGVPMFDRTGGRPQLSAAGSRYLEEIAPALDTIRRATRELRSTDTRVRLTASHSLAVGWLMPRLQAVREHGVDLDLGIEQGMDALRRGQADVAICGGEEAPRDFPSEVLLDLDAFIVSAPKLAGGRIPPESLEDVSRHELLSTVSSPALWARWLERVGRTSQGPARGPTYPTLHAMYEASANGLGLALAVPLAAERFLSEGRLTPQLALRAPIGQQYRLVYADRRQADRRPVATFVAWLKGEIASSQALFQQTAS